MIQMQTNLDVADNSGARRVQCYKQSGMGREEGLAELLSYTQLKNVHVSLA